MLDRAATRGAKRNPLVTFVSYGARLGVRVDEPSVLDAVIGSLPPGRRAAEGTDVDVMYSVRVAPAGSGAEHQLYRGPRRTASATTLEGLLAALESELHFAVATHARPHLFVHAGAVAWRGRGILVPGRSRTGKSELTAALVAAGATYYSDEYAVLDARGRLLPYAKRPGLRRAAGTAKVRLDLPARVGHDAVPVGAVALTRYEQAAEWRPRRATAGEAMTALLDNTVLVRARPRATLDTLARAATGVVALEGPRGDAELMAGRLLEAAACGAEPR